jgi:hypothetical protein
MIKLDRYCLIKLEHCYCQIWLSAATMVLR